jgi:hypothetical protein
MSETKAFDPTTDKFDPILAGLKVKYLDRGWTARDHSGTVELLWISPIDEWPEFTARIGDDVKHLRIPYRTPHAIVVSILFANGMIPGGDDE